MQFVLIGLLTWLYITEILELRQQLVYHLSGHALEEKAVQNA